MICTQTILYIHKLIVRQPTDLSLADARINANGVFSNIGLKNHVLVGTRLATEEEKQKLFDVIKANGYRWNAETKTLEKLIEPKKFDINTLIPFESKVLVRDSKGGKWRPAYWGFYDKDKDNAINYPYECCGNFFSQCIPYEGNEHLLGNTDDCDEFYKTW